jgi:hypothetical protein
VQASKRAANLLESFARREALVDADGARNLHGAATELKNATGAFMCSRVKVPQQGTVVDIGTDIIDFIEKYYATPLEWAALALELKGQGKLQGNPTDIGILTKLIQDNLETQEAIVDIKQCLYRWAKPRIRRGIGTRVQRWYTKVLEQEKTHKCGTCEKDLVPQTNWDTGVTKEICVYCVYRATPSADQYRQKLLSKCTNPKCKDGVIRTKESDGRIHVVVCQNCITVRQVEVKPAEATPFGPPTEQEGMLCSG